MATLKQRLHRKNSSGTYDTIHLETGADCITGTLAIANGGTGATTAANARTNLGVEEALEAKISHTDEFTAEMRDLHGNARGLLCTVPSYAGPESASINAPPDVNWGTCMSLQVGSIRTLMLIDSSGLWIQYYNGTSWSAWKKILSTDITGILDVSHGGTGVTSLAELKSQLGLSVGMYAETINFPFTISYSQPGSYGDYSANVNFTYNFNNPVVGCLLYCSNSYNPTLPEFNRPPADVVSTTFKQSHLLIVDNKDNIEKPLYNYSNDITSGSGGYFHFYNIININNFTSSSITLNITVEGSVYRYQHAGVMQQINGTISGFVVPIYSN